MIDYNGGARGAKARYAVPWRHCHYCGVELRFYFKMAKVCEDCDALRFDAMTRARTIVRAEIRRGALQPATTLPCADCGKPADRYDHRDYSKPKDVQPVCNTCNQRRGPGAWQNKP